jgi:hypothetical protein
MRKNLLSLASREVAVFVLLGSATLFSGCVAVTVFSPEPELVAPLPGPDNELARESPTITGVVVRRESIAAEIAAG